MRGMKRGMKSKAKSTSKSKSKSGIPCSRCPSPSSCKRAGKCLAKAMS